MRRVPPFLNDLILANLVGETYGRVIFRIDKLMDVCK
jgi:hypothetical protein